MTTTIKSPEGNKRLEQLKEVYTLIESGMNAVDSTKEKLQEYGIVSNMHVGKHKDNPSYFDNQQYLCEYFMGQVLNLIENQAWFAMNSGLNIISSYLKRVNEEEALQS